MSKIKLTSVVKNNPSFPTNGFTEKPYKNTNYHTLNDSYKKNGFTHNIWLSKNQSLRVGLKVIDSDNPTYTVDRFGNQSEIFNISQTNYFKPKRKTQKKVTTKPTQITQLERIERLEKLVVELYELVEK